MTPIVLAVSAQGGTPQAMKKWRDAPSIQRKKFGNQTMPAGSQSPNSTRTGYAISLVIPTRRRAAPRRVRPLEGAAQSTKWQAWGSSHSPGQPERDDRERDEDHETDDVRGHEGQHALEDGGEAHVLHHALDDEHVHAH